MIKSMSAAPLRPTHGVGNSALEKASALEKGEKGYRAQKKADAKKKLLQLMPSLVPKNCPTEMEHSALLAKLNCLEKVIADLDLVDEELSARLTKINHDLKKIIADLRLGKDRLLTKLTKIDCDLQKIIAHL